MTDPAAEMRAAAETLLVQLDLSDPSRPDLYSLVGKMHRWATAYERNCATMPGSNVVLFRRSECGAPQDGAA